MTTDPEDSSKPSRRIVAALASTVLTLAASFLGALVGVLFVRFFVPQTGMGWDRIADALGGLMLGASAGLLAGALLAWRLPARSRNRTAAAALVLCLAVVLVLRALSGDSSGDSSGEPAPLTPKTPTEVAPSA